MAFLHMQQFYHFIQPEQPLKAMYPTTDVLEKHKELFPTI